MGGTNRLFRPLLAKGAENRAPKIWDTLKCKIVRVRGDLWRR